MSQAQAVSKDPTPAPPAAAAEAEKPAMAAVPTPRKKDTLPEITLSQGLKECTFSPRFNERWYAWQFWWSCIGIALALAFAGKSWWENKKINDAKEAVIAQKKAFDAEERKRLLTQYTVEIGLFTMELRGEKPTPTARGTVNLAQVGIVAECDTAETCDHIKHDLLGAKNALTGVLTPMDRHELLTKRGKTRIKNSVVDGLNRWLKHGTVRTVYFDRFVIN